MRRRDLAVLFVIGAIAVFGIAAIFIGNDYTTSRLSFGAWLDQFLLQVL